MGLEKVPVSRRCRASCRPDAGRRPVGVKVNRGAHVKETTHGRLLGLTPRGWFHIQRLHPNRPQLVELRHLHRVLQAQKDDLSRAREAEAAGLVARVVAAEAWLDEAKRVAHAIAAKSPVGVRLAKEAVNQAFETNLRAGLDAERKAFHLALSSEDAQEGMKAFLEKRKPEFKGR